MLKDSLAKKYARKFCEEYDSPNTKVRLKEIGRIVSDNLSPDANVIIGARISKEFQGKVRVITIITGVKSPYVLGRDVEEYKQPLSREVSDLGIQVWR